VRARTAERFLATVLMTDIVGSTSHAASVCDPAYDAVIANPHKLQTTDFPTSFERSADAGGALFDQMCVQ